MNDFKQGQLVLLDEGSAIGAIMPETELSPASKDFSLVMVILTSKTSRLKIGALLDSHTSGLKLINEPFFVFERAAHAP